MPVVSREPVEKPKNWYANHFCSCHRFLISCELPKDTQKQFRCWCPILQMILVFLCKKWFVTEKDYFPKKKEIKSEKKTNRYSLFHSSQWQISCINHGKMNFVNWLRMTGENIFFFRQLLCGSYRMYDVWLGFGME